MSRKSLVLGVCLLAVFASSAQADKVKNTGWDVRCCLKARNLDPSTTPATELQDVTFEVKNAGSGTPQNPLGPLATTATLSIANPDPLGVGTAAVYDFFYTGPANEFPAHSFFDVFVDFTQPASNQRARGTIRMISAGGIFFEIEVGTQFAGSPDELTTLLDGQINPAQSGLLFDGLQVVQGTSPDPFATSFFDVFVELQFNGPGAINPNVPLFSITASGVPEPATMALATIGMAALLVSARNRRQATKRVVPFHNLMSS